MIRSTRSDLNTRNLLSSHFVAMAHNNAWSNFRLYRACMKLTDEAFAARRVSFFPSLQLTLNHILLVDRYYLDALTTGGEGLAIFADEIPYPCAAPLWKAQAESDRQLVAFCKSLSDDDLSRVVDIDRGAAIGVHRERIGDVLPHLFVHQIHHRGQAHAMLSDTASAPPQLDEFFLAADAGLRALDLEALESRADPRDSAL